MINFKEEIAKTISNAINIDYKELINFSKPINSSRDYIAKEKDDYER